MKGLVKTAFFGNKEEVARLGNEFMQSVEDKSNMTPDEVSALVQKLREEHGLKSRFVNLGREGGINSAYMDADFLRKYTALDDIPEDGLVQAGPNRELILHEVGHSLDPDVYKDINKGRSLALKAGPGVGFYGGAAGAGVGMAAGGEQDEEKKERKQAVGLGLAGASVGGGLGLAHAGGKMVEGTEDRANDFVKRFLGQELGSVEKAEEAFKQSPLALGRETYRQQSGLFRRNALLNGVVGAGFGGLIGGAMAAHKKKESEQG
jgi:hypothetical protein